MPRSIRYHPLFEADVIGAAAWYDARNPAIGSAFIAEVSRAVDQLTSDPERRSLVDLGVRYWPVSRFPFVVLYDLYGLRYGSAGHLPADLRLSAPGSKRWNRNSPTITSGR